MKSGCLSVTLRKRGMYGRHRPAVVERRLGADARRDEAAAADAHDVLAQVAAEQARRVAEAVRDARSTSS